MSKNVINEIEESIKHSKKQLEFSKCLERLYANRDFNTLIVEGYLKDEAVRLVHLKADPSITNQESVDADIMAIASFAQYLRTVNHRGDMAQKSIETSEAVLDELREEGL